MVRTQKPRSENDNLDEIIEALAEKHGFAVYKTGWARTTYDINLRDANTRDVRPLVRVESFATTSGEICLLDPRGRDFARDLGAELEKAFPAIGEAVIIDDYET